MIEKISNTRNENQIIHHITQFFNKNINKKDKTEALKLLLNVTPQKAITSKKIKNWSPRITGLPPWIIERSETEAGSFLMALALLMRDKSKSIHHPLSRWILELNALESDDQSKLQAMINQIAQCTSEARFILLKLLTGTYRSPVSKIIVTKALSSYLQIPPATASLRLFEIELNNQIDLEKLNLGVPHELQKIPIPFPEIKILGDGWIEALANTEFCHVFGKKEGIMGQLVKHSKDIYLWSSEGIIINDKFPEIIDAVSTIDGNLRITGQIIPRSQVAPFESLLGRLDKKNISKKEVKDAPANFEIWLSHNGDTMIKNTGKLTGFKVLERIRYDSLDQLDSIHKDCRTLGYSGLLISDSRQKDLFYLIKAGSYSIKAVLIYVELDDLSPIGLKSLSFGVFDQNKEIIPVAKAVNFDKEIDAAEIIRYTKKNTLERFGPVRTVLPELLFNLHFDRISKSKRRKSGLILSNVIVRKRIYDPHTQPDDLEKIKKWSDNPLPV